MGLWDDDNFEEVETELMEEVGNIYLNNPAKGLELVAKLLSVEKDYEKGKQVRKLDYLLDFSLLNAVRSLNLSNEVGLSIQLNKISDKIEEYKKIRLLSNKTIIGIGGKFSAGKSKFINALLDDDILPEDQKPTTSIPTYILSSEESSFSAFTSNNQEVELDLQAMQALTHEFYDRYKLGFSQFVRNLVIKSKGTIHDRIAILDTPGYSKYDANTKKSVSDEQKAFDQLKSCDFLIWLMDIENGIIQNRDIDFIKSLGIQTPILFVFNKADKKIETDIKMILKASKEVLNKTDLKIYAVTAYSSLWAQEYFGKTYINDFLETASAYSDRKEDIGKQLNNILSSLNTVFDNMKKNAFDERNFLGNAIFRSEDILSIKSLAELYADSFDQLKIINDCRKNFNQVSRNIQNSFKTLTQ
jgi:transcription termination factor NusB